MKNDTRPLYTLLSHPVATNGSIKKHFSFRKKISLGAAIVLVPVLLYSGFIWFSQDQERQAREKYITWVAKYRPGWTPTMIRTQWEKIQYTRHHTEIVAPTPATARYIAPVVPDYAPPGHINLVAPRATSVEPAETLSDINRARWNKEHPNNPWR
jgi:hypothetical protein